MTLSEVVTFLAKLREGRPEFDNPSRIENAINVSFSAIEQLKGLSPDRQSKFGCVINSLEDFSFLGTGWNGFPALCPDERTKNFPTIRPDKYNHIIHAEMRAILMTLMRGKKLNDAVLFCTASPCVECAKTMAHVGIKGVIFKKAYNSEGLQMLDVFGIPFIKLD